MILDHDPHHTLGLHENTIRIWRPGAKTVHLEVLGQIKNAVPINDVGLFEFQTPRKMTPTDYRVYHSDGSLAYDPYSFLPLIGEMDAYLFNAGRHYEIYKILGANFREVNGVKGVHFAVWAPNAKSVSLISDFNHWDGRVNPMRSMGKSGIWELFVPGLKSGAKYKYEIKTQDNLLRIKSDPYAVYSEFRPKTASVVFDVNQYEWTDEKWMYQRRKSNLNRPMNIYEVHIGSWKKFGAVFPNYREIAPELATYCSDMGFTHIELMPVMEHPFDESWGYQVSGFFAPTSRFGRPDDFQFFVDFMHQRGIGVILDWVPAHFPLDDFSLSRFDGTALYEHEDPRKGLHPHWNTAIFNYGRKEVVNFLIGSALFWLDKMHVDGLRVDAVASMLYLDYGRHEGEWIPNLDGSNINVDAVEFLKHLNSIVHQKFPGVLMVAEESSSYTAVSQPVQFGGLGFDMKWNMGWMNDSLRYFSKDPIYRRFHQNDLTFSLLYAFTEHFLLPLSHDEVVHMKGSLLSKMPGPDWQKFANFRLLYSYMICHPGKKLFFMGGELAMWDEWDCKGQLPWHLLQYSTHRTFHEFVRDMNLFYLSNSPLWKCDFDWSGYEWIDFSDADNSVISYLRKDGKKILMIVHNYTPEYRKNYPIYLKNVLEIKEIFNSDHVKYGGSHKLNDAVNVFSDKIELNLAPLATMIFEVQYA